MLVVIWSQEKSDIYDTVLLVEWRGQGIPLQDISSSRIRENVATFQSHRSELTLLFYVVEKYSMRTIYMREIQG